MNFQQKIKADADFIRSWYRNHEIASDYIDERFSKPLGRVQHQIQVEAIRRVINNYRVNSILEVACGPARLTQDIAIKDRAVAIDSSHQMLGLARHRVRYNSNWHFVQADAFNPGLTQSFQLIYSFRFIRHFKFPDRMKLYKVFHQLLEKRGIVIFDAVHYEKFAFVRKMENHGQNRIYDKIYSSRKELEKEMHRAGYEILQLKGLIHHFYLQAVISRISSKVNLFKEGTKLIQFIERIPFGRPLEWIVICKAL